MTLEELEKLYANASPGPWELGEPWETDEGALVVSIERIHLIDSYLGIDDAEFIAAAHTYMPLLLAVADAAQDLVDDKDGWGCGRLVDMLQALKDAGEEGGNNE